MSYTILPVFYDRNTREGDYSIMICDPQYENAVFLFNESEKDFIDGSLRTGGGSACVRKYRGRRSHGIPTGDSRGGYQVLNGLNMGIIGTSFKRLNEFLKANPRINTIIYSADINSRVDKLVGDGGWSVCTEVKEFITKKIWEFAAQLLPRLPVAVEVKDYMTPWAGMVRKNLPDWKNKTWRDVALALSDDMREAGKGVRVLDSLGALFGKGLRVFRLLEDLGMNKSSMPDRGHLERAAVCIEQLSLSKMKVIFYLIAETRVDDSTYMSARVLQLSEAWLEFHKEEEHAATKF